MTRVEKIFGSTAECEAGLKLRVVVGPPSND